MKIDNYNLVDAEGESGVSLSSFYFLNNVLNLVISFNYRKC